MLYGSIVCLGDSLTNGARCDLLRGYPIELELLLWKNHKQNWNCINAGVNGETSIEIYKRAYNTLRAYPEAAEMILLCGTNDAKVQWQTHPDRYAEHVHAIIRCALRFEKVPYICKIPDLNGFGAPDFCSQDRIDEYNKKVEEIAALFDISLIDLTGFSSDCYADGVHMNNRGYKKMAVKVLEAIEERRLYQGGKIYASR